MRAMCARCGACAAMLLLLAVELGAADMERRADMSPLPFVMGSRYGRSSQPKLISPRNDRFFMGSRYGKRSEGESAGGYRASATLAGSAGAAGAPGLVCEYTGVSLLYRCLGHDERDHYDARSADEARMAEQE